MNRVILRQSELRRDGVGDGTAHDWLLLESTAARVCRPECHVWTRGEPQVAIVKVDAELCAECAKVRTK